MSEKIDQSLLLRLISDIDQLPPAAPSGAMKRQIDETGSWEEDGLYVDAQDYPFGLYYAGLTVLARDMHQYIAEHPRADADLFEEIVSSVHARDRIRYGSGAFPNFDGRPTATLPQGLAQAAEMGKFVISPLLDRNVIVHEWTFKTGKKLFGEFSVKFRDTICGKDGPYEQFNRGLVGQAALPTTIASSVLTVGFSPATFWYPLAVYISVLLMKAGLKTYCKT